MAIESVVVESVVSKITELLVEPVIKQFRYMFCFNNFVQEFSEQAERLVYALYRVQDDVDVAKRNAEEIEIDVDKWLEDTKKALALHGLQDVFNVAKRNAEEIKIHVNKCLEDAKNEMEGVNPLENEQGKCFTWCPKWIPHFKLSKALEKKTETLRKLKEKSKQFQKVSHIVPLQNIEFRPLKEFTRSESSNEAFEQIMKALKDDNVNMIGLYGMGGVGKTTLVQEVGRTAKETQLFDEVLLATVSQNPNVMYIQDRMAESLGLKFDVKTIEGRAGRLWQRLETVKKLLVILDDVWQDVELKEIGIPVGDAHRGCKVLLTTRLIGICSLMQCQQNVLLRILSENEAWALFKINAGLRDEDSNLNTVAKEAARECQGLPIALVTVGRALRGKSVDEWEFASTKLKNSQLQYTERIGEQKNAYACLKLSYDYLKHEETKLCFLLCCLFPEDYNIPIEYLTRYAFGYGLYQDVESIDDARKHIYVEIKTLKDCCMLLGTKTEKHVKMHDLVRDVAIQIASKEHGFMVKAGVGLKEWPRNTKSFESCKTISLMGNKLAELPERLVCPQLKVLLLELDRDLNVPERFFEGMKEIEVLSLEGGCLSLQSLEFSTNLKSLLLIRCKCNDLIWLRKLQRLEILCFIGCSSLEELPDEIGELKELRLLDVSYCSSLRRIPANLIGRLKKLEELLISYNSFTEGTNASLTELNSLSHLAVLSLKIPMVECIPRDFVFPRLPKYDIVLGYAYTSAGHPTSTRLYLRDISAASLNAKTFEQLFPTVSQIQFINVKGLENIALSCDQMTSHGHGSQKDFFQRLEDVEVHGCRDIRTLFPAKWRQALNNLTSVEITRCESLEKLFELGEGDEGSSEVKELRLLSSLTRLKLEILPELKCIWKGPTRHVSLQSLVHLELWSLYKLTFIFTQHLAQSLVHLETLVIYNCSGLKHLIEEKDGEREIMPESLGFPKLKTLSIRGCDELEYVFPVSVSPSLQNLEEIKIVCCANLKQIFYGGEGDAHTSDGVINFPRLRELSLRSGCSFFGPKNFTAQLPSLQVLAIEGHEELGDLLAHLQGHTNLREIRITDCKGAQDRRTGHELSNLSLEKLELTSMPDMRCIWKGLVLSHLTSLKVSRCEKLTHVFTGSMVASLVQLQSLDISDCSELEQIIAKDKDDEREIIQDSLGFPKLKTLSIHRCEKLECVFPVSVSPSLLNLEEMEIEFGANLKQIFYSGEGDALTRDGIINLPQLRILSLSRPKNFTAQLPSLQVLAIKGHEELGDFLAQLQGLTNLRRIYITSCKGAQHLMQAGSFVPNRRTGHEWWQALNNLTSVEIGDCKSLEEVFELGEAGEGINEEKELLSSLTRLELYWLPELKCIWKGPTRHVSLRSLVHLELRGLDKLTFIFTPHLAQSLVHLETLRIYKCSGLKHLIGEKDDEREIIQDSLGFPKLKTLLIGGCDKLEYVFPVSVSPSLLNLERLVLSSMPDMRCIWKGLVLSHLTSLEVYDCHKLTHVFTGSMVASLVQLQYLKIRDCSELEQIIAKDNDDEREIIQESLRFPKLKTLRIRGCDKLEYVFPVSVSPSLLNLEVMEIEFGDNLKQIFYSGEGDALTRDGVISFPRLRELSLSSGCSLFGPKHFTAQLPSLKVLAIDGHEELGDLLAQLQGHTNLRKIHITNCKGAQDRRTGHELSLLSLEKLHLKSLPDMRCIWKGLVLSHLTTLKVYDCHKLTRVFTGSMVASLVQLQSLDISDCSELEQIIAKDKDDEREIIQESVGFPKLKTLSISGCDKLEYVFPVSVSPSLVHLETLKIDDCSGLKHLIGENDDEREIIQESVGFPKLKTLSISGCDKLEYVFPVSVSPSLLNLEEMEIEFGDNLKQIFYSGEGDALTRDGIINFPRLRKLSLSRPTNFTAQLPSLHRLSVEGHEQLGNLLAQLQGHTNLRKMCIKNCKGAQDRRTGHELSLLSLERLVLSSMPDMRCIWKGLVLSHLTTLEVYDCHKLTHVFTGSMVASLVQLQYLKIRDCEELEQIIAKDNDDEKDQILSGSDLHSGEKCFPNLSYVNIKGCNKLRSLFPVAMAAGLPKLEDLDVRDSSQLLGVFWQDDEASPVNVEKQMVLPNLSFLRLDNLPSIVCFSLGCDDFLFPRLGKPMVRECPKLTTKFD